MRLSIRFRIGLISAMKMRFRVGYGKPGSLLNAGVHLKAGDSGKRPLREDRKFRVPAVSGCGMMIRSTGIGSHTPAASRYPYTHTELP